jgi:hypothetical protein
MRAVCVCVAVAVAVLAPASSRLGVAIFVVCGCGKPFGVAVIVDVLDCTLHCDSFFPSAVSFCAALFVGFLGNARAESRWGGGLSEWGDTMTAGKGKGRGECEYG